MISVEHIYTVVTSAQFIDSVIRYCSVIGIVLSVVSNACSFFANYIPDPQEEKIHKTTAFLSKAVNFVALNMNKVKKV